METNSRKCEVNTPSTSESANTTATTSTDSNVNIPSSPLVEKNSEVVVDNTPVLTPTPSSPVVEKKVEETKVEETKVEVAPTPSEVVTDNNTPLYPVLSNDDSNKNDVTEESKPQEPSPFEVKLKQLEDMGFSDKQRNVELMVKNNGDMLQVVRDLLEH